ncbi:unnamed protein product [Phyllotreta striolata]|uniref:Vitamin K-dependent gamma-carboxylase n=1 Tax=Phyllotreta striolata TaxID=444603 RepID=A0A9N9T9J8_PHYSR|nr:unnamed protein product [Phyllotreta striolata]
MTKDEEHTEKWKITRCLSGYPWNRLKWFNYEDLVRLMYRPTDPSSLGVIRFLFGFLMLTDLPEERAGAFIDLRWGNPRDCHFPLFPFMTNPGYSVISLVYLALCISSCGIMLGYKFKSSAIIFAMSYWYLFLLDKSFWNNHSYLFGIVSILLVGSSANHYFSVDAMLDPSIRNADVPYWNYFILKYQFFLLYFLAGLKKMDFEWLEGYSMVNLGTHWVFSPFRIVLTSDQIDYLIVHWFGFLLDLTVGFWMLIEYTRPVAMVFCASFHLMNSRLFSIGMFPYVCLATMPLFCEENWPKKIISFFARRESIPDEKRRNSKSENKRFKPKLKHKLVVAWLLCHCGLQGFLPYSHFITKGYNNWTDGLYGYSWDMMVHSWNTVHVVIKLVDNVTGKEQFIDNDAYTVTDRWNKHADMCVQYAQCLKRNLENANNTEANQLEGSSSKFPNVSIYIDVWCSMNKRFQQRMFDPTYDLLKANWSPFRPVEWLMPILSEYNDFRRTMNEITEHVYSWSNKSDVLFIADFPGLHLENFIDDNLENITLTVLEGEVVFEIEDHDSFQSLGIKLGKGESVPVDTGVFHKVHVISETPSCYMYTFSRKESEEQPDNPVVAKGAMHSPFPLVENFGERGNRIVAMWKHIRNGIFDILFGIPYEI